MSAEVVTGSGSLVVGRYLLFSPLARGGMATVYLGRLAGAAGFDRVVAIKRLNPDLTRDPDLFNMLIDEAQLAARIRHPNVVQPLDVIAHEGELLVVMDYVEGEALSALWREMRTAKTRLPLPIVSGIMCSALAGLHAAHQARGKDGKPLGIVHRDVSPQNILVGTDGVARIIDFGIAKAVGTARAVVETRDGRVKGKLAYMAPEQVRGERVTPRTDVFAAGIVLWEAIVGARLFATDGDVTLNVLEKPIKRPGAHVEGVPPALDEVVLKALDRDPTERFSSALEMAVALEAALAPAPAREIGNFVQECARAELERRAALVARLEQTSAPEAETAPEVKLSSTEDEGSLTQLSGTALSKLHATRKPSSRRYLWLATLVFVVSAAGVAFAARMTLRPIQTSMTRLGSVSVTIPSVAPPPASAAPSTTSAASAVIPANRARPARSQPQAPAASNPSVPAKVPLFSRD